MNPAPQDLEFGAFRLNPRRRELRAEDGAAVELSPKAFDLLLHFLEHPGVLIDRTVLLEAVWPGTVVEENNLNQAILALRRTLGEDVIKTVRGRGYQFIADVRRVNAGGNPEEAASRPRTGRRVVVYGALLAAVIAALFLGRSVLESARQSSPANERSAAKSAPPSDSAQAYAHYLVAMESVGDTDFFASGHVPDVHLTELDAAIEADPAFAAALGARALAHLMAALNLLQAAHADRDAALRETEFARGDGERALALDPQLGVGHAVLGSIDLLAGDVPSAQGHFEQVSASSPDDARILSFVAGCWLRHGARERALALLEQVRTLKPVDQDVGYFFYLAGDRTTAREILRRMASTAPARADVHMRLGYTAAIDGDAAEALTHLRVAEELVAQQGVPAGEMPSMLAGIAYSYGRLGLAAEARRAADQFASVATEDMRAAPMLWTEVYLALGEREKAYLSASLAVDTLPFLMLEEMVLNSPSDAVLEQPRFRQLRARAQQRLSLRREL